MNRYGFTLLEVLVAAVIISLVSGISLVGYNRFQERQQLVAAKEQLRNDLRLAQQKALAGEKPTGWCTGSGKTLSSWRLGFTSASVYEIRGVCSDATTVFDRLITLPANIVKSAGADQVDFLPVSGSAAAAAFSLRFAAASGTWVATVSVTDSGLIESSDISL